MVSIPYETYKQVLYKGILKRKVQKQLRTETRKLHNNAAVALEHQKKNQVMNRLRP
jgi:hypothetical protein